MELSLSNHVPNTPFQFLKARESKYPFFVERDDADLPYLLETPFAQGDTSNVAFRRRINWDALPPPNKTHISGVQEPFLILPLFFSPFEISQIHPHHN